MTKIFIPKPKSALAKKAEKERLLKERRRKEVRLRSARADILRWMLLSYIGKTSAMDFYFFLDEYVKLFESDKKRMEEDLEMKTRLSAELVTTSKELSIMKCVSQKTVRRALNHLKSKDLILMEEKRDGERTNKLFIRVNYGKVLDLKLEWMSKMKDMGEVVLKEAPVMGKRADYVPEPFVINVMDKEMIKGNMKKEKERVKNMKDKLIRHNRFLSMMDAKERAILQVLMKRCDDKDGFQISVSRLALFLGMSDRVVKYKLEKLEKRGFIHYLDSYENRGGVLEAWTYRLDWNAMTKARVKHSLNLRKKAERLK